MPLFFLWLICQIGRFISVSPLRNIMTIASNFLPNGAEIPCWNPCPDNHCGFIKKQGPLDHSASNEDRKVFMVLLYVVATPTPSFLLIPGFFLQNCYPRNLP